MMDRHNEKGFTLIEIMVVIIIMGILATYVALNVTGKAEQARHTQATIQIGTLKSAMTLYKIQNGNYPSTEQGLNTLVELPTVGTLPKNWQQGGYLDSKNVPKDPWGNDYVYLCPGIHGDFDISSYGNDNAQGGEGDDADVNSWELEK